jgi:hypothetical protein
MQNGGSMAAASEKQTLKLGNRFDTYRPKPVAWTLHSARWQQTFVEREFPHADASRVDGGS